MIYFNLFSKTKNFSKDQIARKNRKPKDVEDFQRVHGKIN